jgi:hypothetical protein
MLISVTAVPSRFLVDRSSERWCASFGLITMNSLSPGLMDSCIPYSDWIPALLLRLKVTAVPLLRESDGPTRTAEGYH